MLLHEMPLSYAIHNSLEGRNRFTDSPSTSQIPNTSHTFDGLNHMNSNLDCFLWPFNFYRVVDTEFKDHKVEF